MSGCTAFERRDYESRIAEVSEVYPTEKVSDLFKKFPNGYSIFYRKEEVVDGKTFYHQIDLEGDKETKIVSGKYSKLTVDFKELLTVPVVYDDVNGLIAQEDYQFEPVMQDFAFAFQKVNLNKKEMEKMTFMDIASNPVLRSFSIRYNIKNKSLNKYIGLPNEAQLEIDFRGEKNVKAEQGYHVLVLVTEGLRHYFTEIVTAY